MWSLLFAYANKATLLPLPPSLPPFASCVEVQDLKGMWRWARDVAQVEDAHMLYILFFDHIRGGIVHVTSRLSNAPSRIDPLHIV